MRTKEKLRNAFRALRDAMPSEVRAAKDRLIYERVLGMETFRDAETVLSYISMGSEVDTRGIIEHVFARRLSLLVPAVRAQRRLAWYPLDSWD